MVCCMAFRSLVFTLLINRIMEKLKENIKFSIKLKIFLLIVSIILFVSSSLVSFFLIRSKAELEKEIEKRGILEINRLVLDVEYAVLTKNLTSLENILKSRLLKPDIVYLEIIGNNENSLTVQQKSEYGTFFKINEPISNLGKNVQRSSLSSSTKDKVRFYEFISPILSERLVSNEFENELDLIMMGGKTQGKQYLPSKIGKAKIAITLETMDKQMSNLLFGSIFIVIIIVAISILFSVFFTNKIVAPIRNVALTAIEISEGNLKKRVKVNSSDETGILALNFNKMAISLQQTVDNLKEEITQRNQATLNLQKNEEKYRKLIESANDAIFIADAENGIIVDVNRKAEKLLGLPSSEIIGMQQAQLHPKEESERYKELFFDEVQKKEGFIGIPEDVYVCHRDGVKVPVEISTNVIDLGDKKFIQGIFRDISERKAMEDELRSTKYQLQEIIDNTTAIIYLKGIDGRYLLINKRYEIVFNIKQKDILGKSDYDIFPKELADSFRKNDSKVIKANKPLEIEEFAPHDDGLHTYISVKFPVYDTSNVLYGVCGISTDITERKKIEKEILKIEENERNRIGRDLHDSIGQLLTIVFINLQVLQKELEMKALEKESKQAKRIVDLTNSTIKHTRMLAKGLSPLSDDEDDLYEMLEELIFNTESIFGISCDFECNKNVLSYDYSVKTNLYRIAQEAINNAIKHANPKNITVMIHSQNGNTIFQIKDDGSGIEKSQNMKKGMGLRTMKYRANLIGASLDIDNDINGGTIVNCKFKVENKNS